MKLKDIYMRDPYIFVEDDVCYLVGSTDENPFSDTASGFLAFTSKDLVNFEGPYPIFENDGTFWSTMNYWAPELFKINGKYCLFASFIAKGRHRSTQVLTCDTPIGKYIPTAKPYTPSEWDCLDGTYYEENGKKYSFFCHEWTQINDGTICVGELNDELTELTNVKTLFKASEAKWAKSFKVSDDNSRLNYVTDGPFIYKRKNGRLLMLWSSPSDNGYALGVCYSDTGVSGNWIHLDEPLYKNDGGHGMIFEFKGDTYLIIHINNSKNGQERPKLLKVIEENDMIHLEEIKED